jgi:hypothetical protein
MQFKQDAIEDRRTSQFFFITPFCVVIAYAILSLSRSIIISMLTASFVRDKMGVSFTALSHLLTLKLIATSDYFDYFVFSN